ncbi:MAG: DUF1638 domain-containing protein [Clostridia bacterium]|nr:DUF1638 domain-containing protein [Clostridia bacterium]
MKLKLIGCQVFLRELYLLCAHSPHSVQIRWMPTDLHTRPQTDLRPALQREIDRIDEEDDPCDAIILGYGLCSMGTVGLKAGKHPLIIPRVHDCITLLLGSREKYQELFDKYSGGVYWYSPGWIEQFKEPGRGYDEQAKYMEYVEKYGEENAEYLIEVEKSWIQNYSLAALIEWPQLKSDRFDAFTRQAAKEGDLEYLRLVGEDTLMKKLVFGEWDESFLRVEPGQKIVYSADEQLMEAE